MGQVSRQVRDPCPSPKDLYYTQLTFLPLDRGLWGILLTSQQVDFRTSNNFIKNRSGMMSQMIEQMAVDWEVPSSNPTWGHLRSASKLLRYCCHQTWWWILPATLLPFEYSVDQWCCKNGSRLPMWGRGWKSQSPNQNTLMWTRRGNT